MLNVRTWYWLSLSGCIIFPAVIAGWMLPPNSAWNWPVLIAIGWGILVAVFGAFQGIMFAFGKLYMGCPRCRARSHVTGGDRNGMFLDCPGCGFLRVETGFLSGMKMIKRGEHDDEEESADDHPLSDSPLRAPLRHLVPFLIIFSPVVAAVIAASVIHEFSFFYLIIPGFFCYAVGGLILNAIYHGSLSDNHGTALRSRSPIRFWAKVAIWSIAYLFAAVFPIGFALQESAKAAAKSEQTGAGNPSVRAEAK